MLQLFRSTKCLLGQKTYKRLTKVLQKHHLGLAIAMAIDRSAINPVCSQFAADILWFSVQAKSVLEKEDAYLPTASHLHLTNGSCTEPILPGHPSAQAPLGPSRPPKKDPYMTGSTSMACYESAAKQVSLFYASQDWLWVLPCKQKGLIGGRQWPLCIDTCAL